MSPPKRIQYTKPSITDLEVEYASDAARNGWGAQCYAYIERFEKAFAAHLGVPHTIATSSCTGAMHMGLAALGIGKGDEVILADTNWIATVAPLVHLGATPVFVDIDPVSWCLDPALTEAAITPQTKAIIATHLYGNLADMDALLAIGERHGIPVIEDAAEAIGSQLHGRRAGSMGLFSTFSFHGTKTVTTGEGGLFATRDAGLFETVLTLSNHGRARGETRQFWPSMIGFKYKMSNIEAAIGCAQVERIDDLIAGKRAVFEAYRRRLAGTGITLNPEPEGAVNGYWMPTAVFPQGTTISIDALVARFNAADIDARVFFHPLSSLPMFADQPHNIVARDMARRAINLPSFHGMEEADVERVVAVLYEFA